MKTQRFCSIRNHFVIGIFILLNVLSLPFSQVFANDYTEFKGVVVDRKTGDPLAFASILVTGTHIATVSNANGEYLIKVPKEIDHPKVEVSFIGYKTRTILLESLISEKNRIELENTVVSLPEFKVVSKDAEALITAMMEKKAANYPMNQQLMTSFYRETIKKGRTYVSLAEAVFDVYKQSYGSDRMDIVKMYKSRKKTDYSKLDTLAFKLMGGPFNSLRLDVMKNPDALFTENMIENYDFSFDKTTHIDNRMIYIVNFKQKSHKTDPLYAGKLFIDANSMALKSAVFELNVENRELASKMFILKKPARADVYPTSAIYRIDYREKDGKWYYSYSRIELIMKVNWNKKLFKTTYNSTIEMAATNWELNPEKQSSDTKERIRPSIVISDEASGFSDPQFWGDYNVIEPEKTIESAIKKIQKNLKKENL